MSSGLQGFLREKVTTMWLGICTRLVVSILLGGVMGLTLQQLGYDEEITFNPGDVSGLRVLITGASSGIGEQLAYQYSQHGARVYLTARREDQLKRVAEACRQKGSLQAEYLAADFTRMVDAAKVVHMAQKALGGLDQMILGHAYFSPIGRWAGSGRDLSDIQQVFDVNVKSYIHLATHAIPHLRASNGSIGIVSSVAAKLYVPYRALYTMSKHALDGFFSTLRAELREAGHNVSVTSCILGGVDTQRKRTELEEAEENLAINLKDTYQQLASSADTAHVIMSGITARRREIYFPPSQNVKPQILFGELFPRYSEISFALPMFKR